MKAIDRLLTDLEASATGTGNFPGEKKDWYIAVTYLELWLLRWTYYKIGIEWTRSIGGIKIKPVWWVWQRLIYHPHHPITQAQKDWYGTYW